MYNALSSYFLSINHPPEALKLFFKNTLSEAYLMFVQILKMKKQSNSVIESMFILEVIDVLLKVRVDTAFLPLCNLNPE